MKKQICINVDVEALLVAQSKIPNISSYLNECLKGLTGKSDTELSIESLMDDIKAIDNSINELIIKKSIKEMDLKMAKELHEERLKEQKLKEQLQRWKCGACKSLNTMDLVRCNNCGLPTRNDNKTTIVYVESD